MARERGWVGAKNTTLASACLRLVALADPDRPWNGIPRRSVIHITATYTIWLASFICLVAHILLFFLILLIPYWGGWNDHCTSRMLS